MALRKLFNFCSLAMMLCVFLMSAGCGEIKNTAYSEFVAYGSDGWDPIAEVSFAPYPADSTLARKAKFDIIVTLRYSPRNLTAQIPLEITEEDETGVISTERRTIRLVDEQGDPRGEKSLALYELSDTLRRGFSIPEGYIVSFTSLSPAENTRCLRNLGVTLLTVN